MHVFTVLWSNTHANCLMTPHPWSKLSLLEEIWQMSVNEDGIAPQAYTEFSFSWICLLSWNNGTFEKLCVTLSNGCLTPKTCPNINKDLTYRPQIVFFEFPNGFQTLVWPSSGRFGRLIFRAPFSGSKKWKSRIFNNFLTSPKNPLNSL